MIFRRGSPTSHDVDLLITHDDDEKTCNLLKRFLVHLNERGKISNNSEKKTVSRLYFSSFSSTENIQ